MFFYLTFFFLFNFILKVFDAYSQCEESLIAAKIQEAQQEGSTEEGDLLN